MLLDIVYLRWAMAFNLVKNLLKLFSTVSFYLPVYLKMFYLHRWIQLELFINLIILALLAFFFRPLFLYSCGRPSQIWDAPPRTQQEASQRVQLLANPKAFHSGYKEDRCVTLLFLRNWDVIFLDAKSRKNM